MTDMIEKAARSAWRYIVANGLNEDGHKAIPWEESGIKNQEYQCGLVRAVVRSLAESADAEHERLHPRSRGNISSHSIAARWLRSLEERGEG